jgi:hypothetical protein
MDLKLDTTGDLDISDDALHLVDGADAIAQHVQIRLRLFKGEWFLDAEVGLPYYDTVLVKAPDLLAIRSVIRQAILETPGVASLDGFEMEFDRAARSLAVSFTATTDDGQQLDFSRRFVIP